MALPTKDNPRVKKIAKSRNGLPIFSIVKTWFEKDNQHQWNQYQSWTPYNKEVKDEN